MFCCNRILGDKASTFSILHFKTFSAIILTVASAKIMESHDNFIHPKLTAVEIAESYPSFMFSDKETLKKNADVIRTEAAEIARSKNTALHRKIGELAMKAARLGVWETKDPMFGTKSGFLPSVKAERERNEQYDF
ncbi:MAG: hypothetical protein LBE03_00120, partial [Candidatus Nomurabacteria bacterium]|nr:hypothetical protein [Candidatus Nomurabacteria bacterium]